MENVWYHSENEVSFEFSISILIFFFKYLKFQNNMFFKLFKIILIWRYIKLSINVFKTEWLSGVLEGQKKTILKHLNKMSYRVFFC